MSDLHKRFAEIQTALKAPKGQNNTFGKYKYRSCEDILEAVKPILNGLVLTISDTVELIGDRYYINATATITDGTDSIVTNARARESEDKKGMDAAQITGACSSYARKYALNGLFCIDDTKDVDTDEHSAGARKAPPSKGNASNSMKIFAGILKRDCENEKNSMIDVFEKLTGFTSMKEFKNFDKLLDDIKVGGTLRQKYVDSLGIYGREPK